MIISKMKPKAHIELEDKFTSITFKEGHTMSRGTQGANITVPDRVRGSGSFITHIFFN